jgi:hypothetical protein
MPPLNREPRLKPFIPVILFAFLCLAVSFYFIIRASQVKLQEKELQAPSTHKDAIAFDELAYEAWIIRYLENYSKTYYKEIHTSHLTNESIRLSQHKRLAEDYTKLLNDANAILAPRRYVELHDILREEAWISSQMHMQYPLSYTSYKLSYFQKMKKRNQALLLMEKQEPKLLFRWLIQEKATFQANSQDK